MYSQEGSWSEVQLLKLAERLALQVLNIMIRRKCNEDT